MKKILLLILFPALLSSQSILTSIINQDDYFVCDGILGGSQDFGRFTFCWDKIEVPAGDGTTAGNIFANNTLQLAIEENPSMITVENGRLKFLVTPRTPAPVFPSNPFNMRAEIIQNPWLASLPELTEEWFSYEMKMSDDYVINAANSWAMMQHKSTDWFAPNYDANDPILSRDKRSTPVLSIHIADGNLYGAQPGELMIFNFTGKPIPSSPSQIDTASRVLTGIIPQAGQKLEIVHHIIHSSDDAVGLWQVWINKVLVHNETKATLYKEPSLHVSGNLKLGAYMQAWRTEEGVSASEAVGCNKMELTMGSLRIVRKAPADLDYLSDELAYMYQIFN